MIPTWTCSRCGLRLIRPEEAFEWRCADDDCPALDEAGTAWWEDDGEAKKEAAE